MDDQDDHDDWQPSERTVRRIYRIAWRRTLLARIRRWFWPD